jgi:hypothetical protein
MARGHWTSAALISLAAAAGVLAALAGGVVEDLTEWIFVGVPMCLLLLGYAVRSYGRRRH